MPARYGTRTCRENSDVFPSNGRYTSSRNEWNDGDVQVTCSGNAAIFRNESNGASTLV